VALALSGTEEHFDRLSGELRHRCVTPLSFVPQACVEFVFTYAVTP
jgi:hypothetical protein